MYRAASSNAGRPWNVWLSDNKHPQGHKNTSPRFGTQGTKRGDVVYFLRVSNENTRTVVNGNSSLEMAMLTSAVPSFSLLPPAICAV